MFHSGVKEVLSKVSSLAAEVLVYGTPAEEGGGGKLKMIEEKVFDEADVCMMSHPTPFEIPTPLWLAIETIKFVFHGKYFVISQKNLRVQILFFFTNHMLLFALLVLKLTYRVLFQ